MEERDSEPFATLRSVACGDSDIVFVVAFGSQVTGEATTASDLDIAVKFTDELSDSERFEKRCFLSGNLQGGGRPFVDVSDIQELPLDAVHDAINGRFVCGDEEAFERFRGDIQARFSEQNDELRNQQRAVIAHIAEDGLRG